MPRLSLIVALLLSCDLYAQTDDEMTRPGPTRFEGYPDAPAISIVPRKDELKGFPCSRCHEGEETNPEIREVRRHRRQKLNHGRGRMWCLTCHSAENRDYLITLLGEQVDFDDDHVICGGCHGRRHRDWYFGAHGKRLGTWDGERVNVSCTHCHEPHDPGIKPRAPMAAPSARAGLERPEASERETHRRWSEGEPDEGEQSDEH